MDRHQILQKLQELRSVVELEKGFPDKRSCLSWAVKVEPLLNFNLSLKADFSWSLMSLQSANSCSPHIDRMKTILDMAIEQLKNEIESDPTVERDALTKLWTRGRFNSDLIQYFAEAERVKHPLSLIMVDIDYFKKVNDTYGHLKGDEVLIGVAACILSITEGKGQVYRYGGEEMVVILSNYDTREAIAIAERIRRRLESMSIASISITASFGVGTFPDHGGNSTEIIKAADTALYDAKNRGRNLVRAFGEPEPSKDKEREPERKLPLPGVLTDKQKSHLRHQYFMGAQIRCPRDQAILTVEEISEIGNPTVRLLIWCKLCGLSDEL